MADERRLIDAGALIAELRKSAEYHELRRPGYYSAIVHIKEQPTVDAVEVCYCRNCKYYAVWADGRSMNHCDKHDRTAYDDDFCSYGERRCE